MFKQFFSRSRIKIFLSFLVGVAVALGGSYAWNGLAALRQPLRPGPLRLPDEQFPHISPLLACGLSVNKATRQYQSMENTMKNLVLQEQERDGIERVSIYYQDLSAGRWTGVQEYDTYSPASLLKVPMMMHYFKQAEDDPTILSRKIKIFASDIQGGQEIPPAQSIQAGHEYTIDELIWYMIVHSDNDAFHILTRLANNTSVLEMITDLGVEAPKANSNYVISAKTYSLFFRILYNSTYLNREYSEKALKILNQVEYKDGLVAPLPLGIQVAHKFGEAPFITEDGKRERELHDCGIVYFPEHPYFLCVMTKGQDPVQLQQAIQKISEMVFDITQQEPAKQANAS